jgi:CubicO group peptidase (beta-lactamase class C family)
MKILKRALWVVLALIVVVVYLNYPKLNILAGYSAKNTASSVFVGERSLAFTDSTDNNFSPINLTTDKINRDEQWAKGSVYGLLTRKAVYRPGLGAVLVNDDFDPAAPYAVPNRYPNANLAPYPFGKGAAVDTTFSHVDYAKLQVAVDSLFAPKNKTRALVILHKDQLLYEKYSAPITKDSKLLGWSMTKSITSTMFGILQTQGGIDVHAPAPIEAWKNDERKKVTIHNLLQMNSGLEWVEDYNTISDVTKMLFLEEDMTQTQITKPLVGTPNATWNYSSGTTNLLSGILRQQFASHQEYLDFWYRELIDKIGMNSMLIETDMSGNYVGSSYAWATPRDWAKLGLLYLHNGCWNNEELFTEDWVKYATTPTPTSDGWYGAQIWLNAGKRYPDVPKSMYSFNGYQGQNVFILPEQDLVIVRMGLTKNADINVFLSAVIASIKN